VDRHLPEGYSAEPDVISTAPLGQAAASPQLAPTETPESSLRLQGGDMHRDIFKIKARANKPRRAATFSHLVSDHESIEASVDEPGGFRRQFLAQQSMQRRLSSVATPVTKNFVSFLELYGSFAGEDLADTDDELDTDNDDAESAIFEDRREQPASETRPLLGHRKSTKRAKKEGDAGTMKTFFTLLKAFVGTGIMFLPKAFRNGGILFSSITLVTISIITTLCFRLLLQCRAKCGGGGYGEIGGTILGRRFRSLVLGSITLSQLGFVCTGLIFTAENLLAFLNAVVPS